MNPDKSHESEARGERGRSFTGRRFSRKPRRSVVWVDDLARRLITISGIGSIVAVTLVGLFLVWVALPLLLPARIEKERDVPGGTEVVGPDIVATAIDNYGIMSWSLTAAGEFIVRSLGTGEVLARVPLVEQGQPTAWTVGPGTSVAAFGYANGSTRIAELSWQTRFLEDDDVPPSYRDLAQSESRSWEQGLLVRTPEGQLRHQKLKVVKEEPVSLGSVPIRLLDLVVTPTGMVLVALDSTNVFHDRKLTFKTNMLTGKTRVRARGGELDLAGKTHVRADSCVALRLNDTGDLAVLLRADGEALQLGRDGQEFVVTGHQDLVPDKEARVTATAFLSGRNSLAVGDSRGGVGIWFPARKPGEQALTLQRAHVLPPGETAVSSLAASTRSRMLAVGYVDGQVHLFNATNERLLGRDEIPGQRIRSLTIAPREDLLLVVGQSSEGLWKIEAEYGEVSFRTLFRPIWYEGSPGPAYVWQSSAASDSFEPKLSLVPLIFGTLKATFYSLLFGLPLAFLAAIYTSEFLSRGARNRVKPVIEIMASLPSVVLGFLAALVVAPWVEGVVVEVLTVLLLAPVTVLLGAQLWQLLPQGMAARLQRWRPLGILASLVLGAWLGWLGAPQLEKMAFGGDFKAWLAGQIGTGTPGWFFLLLVPVSVLVAWLGMRYGEGVLRGRGPGWGRRDLALLDLGRFVVGVVVAVGATLFLSWLLNASGWDPRGSVFDTYVQRNALVVGLAMGFAVIPLIYTISEDALVAVPDHLRAASLGAGATTWQTTIRVVVPPAMSGLFSAAMIGVGRAVGETMIVLMAAGNTPIMEMNIFNGFRTLSANLAVELPEAVQNSTHYRTLFLAALTLFVMTFILNTVAEAVRLHFRGKTSRL